MKKGNILIAVFTIIVAAASVGKTEEVKINFDGNNNVGSVDFMESIRIAASNKNNEIVSPRVGLRIEAAPEHVFTQGVSNSKKGEARVQIIRKNILKSMPFLSHEVVSISEDHNTVVCFTTESVLLIKPIGGGKYALLKELIDHKLVKSIKEKENAILGAGQGDKYWTTIKKCYDIIVYVTTLVNGYEVAKPVVKKVCEAVQEWVDAPSNPSSGWGPGTTLPNPNHVRFGN